MNGTCPQCGSIFTCKRRRVFCCNRCYYAARALRKVPKAKPRVYNRDVEVNGGLVKIRNGRTRVVSAHRMASVGVTDNFTYLTAINCECGANTAYNPYALPGFNFASRDWRRIDAEHKSGVCPRCAAKMAQAETELQKD